MQEQGNQLMNVIKSEDLQSVSTDIIEIVVDEGMEDGFLKEVPILSTFVRGYNVVTSIQDKLFMKKILFFLNELKSVPQDSRLAQIVKIEDDVKYRTKVGEKLLYIINKSDDLDKAAMVGILFKNYLEKKVLYDDFLGVASLIDNCPLPDLLWFIKSDFKEMTLEEGSQLVSFSLMEIRMTDPKISIKRDPPFGFSDDKYTPSEEEVLQSKMSIEGLSVYCEVSWLGKIMRDCLKNY